MLMSHNTDKIIPALFAVKKELESVKKTSNNPFYKSKYANLNDHLAVVEPLLEKHGCFVMQPPLAYGPETVLETYIIHGESGQYVCGSMSLILTKQDMQQLCAASTYARRFVLSGLLAMTAEDDDGNTASGKTTTETAPKTSLPSSGGFKSGGGFGGFKKKAEPAASNVVEEPKSEIKKGNLY